MGGICVGASFVTVAAQDDRIRDKVKFVNFLAGYYDISDLARAIGSRSRFGEGYSAPWAPDSLTYEVFRYHLITGVSSVADRRILAQAPRGGEADESTVEALTEEGRAVYRLLTGTSLEEADALVDQLSTADEGALPEGVPQHQHREAVCARPHHARQGRRCWCRRRSHGAWPTPCPRAGTSTIRNSPCSRGRYNSTWERRRTWACSTSQAGGVQALHAHVQHHEGGLVTEGSLRLRRRPHEAGGNALDGYGADELRYGGHRVQHREDRVDLRRGCGQERSSW